jgi:hypothetical protein
MEGDKGMHIDKSYLFNHRTKLTDLLRGLVGLTLACIS